MSYIEIVETFWNFLRFVMVPKTPIFEPIGTGLFWLWPWRVTILREKKEQSRRPSLALPHDERPKPALRLGTRKETRRKRKKYCRSKKFYEQERYSKFPKNRKSRPEFREENFWVELFVYLFTYRFHISFVISTVCDFPRLRAVLTKY